VVPAQELELGVGAAWWGRRVRLAQQMLGGYRKGGGPLGAEYEQYGVREGIKGEVSPVLLGWSWLEAWEG